jgi:hypothetical protein
MATIRVTPCFITVAQEEEVRNHLHTPDKDKPGFLVNAMLLLAQQQESTTTTIVFVQRYSAHEFVQTYSAHLAPSGINEGLKWFKVRIAGDQHIIVGDHSGVCLVTLQGIRDMARGRFFTSSFCKRASASEQSITVSMHSALQVIQA